MSENVVERKILENESDTGIHSVEFSEWHADTLQKIDFHEKSSHAEKNQWNVRAPQKAKISVDGSEDEKRRINYLGKPDNELISFSREHSRTQVKKTELFKVVWILEAILVRNNGFSHIPVPWLWIIKFSVIVIGWIR